MTRLAGQHATVTGASFSNGAITGQALIANGTCVSPPKQAPACKRAEILPAIAAMAAVLVRTTRFFILNGVPGSIEKFSEQLLTIAHGTLVQAIRNGLPVTVAAKREAIFFLVGVSDGTSGSANRGYPVAFAAVDLLALISAAEVGPAFSRSTARAPEQFSAQGSAPSLPLSQFCLAAERITPTVLLLTKDDGVGINGQGVAADERFAA